VQPATDAFAAFIGGFVAAEGTFGCAGEPPVFTFAIGLGTKGPGFESRQPDWKKCRSGRCAWMRSYANECVMTAI